MSEIEQLQDLLHTQGQHGNWNYAPYMHGMYNGLALAVSVLIGGEPAYRDAPIEWLCDRVSDGTAPTVADEPA